MAIPVNRAVNVTKIGVGVDPDVTNPVNLVINRLLSSAKPIASGGDGNIRHVLSKEALGNFLSLLFQTNLSGRAEIGLLGNDNLSIKVSADGTTWFDAIIIDKSTGTVTFPNTTTTDIERIRRCPSRAALAALDPAGDPWAILEGAAIGGVFKWVAGDYTAAVALDAAQGMFVASTVGGYGASAGCWVRDTDVVATRFFGAKLDGVSDDSAAFNLSLKVARRYGTRWVAGKGTALFAAQVTLMLAEADNDFNANASKFVCDFSGCTIKTSGAISGLRVFGNQQQRSVEIANLKIDHLNNATAIAGLELVATSNVTVTNFYADVGSNRPRTKGNDNNSGDEGYSAILMRPARTGDPVNTNAPVGALGYWNHIYNPFIRGYNMLPLEGPIGVHVQGQINNCSFYNMVTGNLRVGVLFSSDGANGVADYANSTYFSNPSFEQIGYAFKVERTVGTDNYAPAAVDVKGGRFEQVLNKVDFGPSTDFSPSGPWRFIGGFTSGCYAQVYPPIWGGQTGNEYVNIDTKPRLRVNSFDPSFGSSSVNGFGGGGGYWKGHKPFKFVQLYSADHAVEVNCSSNYGISFRVSDESYGLLAGWIGGSSQSYGNLRVQGRSDNCLEIAGVRALSSVATRQGANFTGQATLPVSSATVTVTFGAAEPNTAYRVHIGVQSFTGAPTIGMLTVKSITKTTAGFTVTFFEPTTSGDTVTFSWLIVS